MSRRYVVKMNVPHAESGGESERTVETMDPREVANQICGAASDQPGKELTVTVTCHEDIDQT